MKQKLVFISYDTVIQLLFNKLQRISILNISYLQLMMNYFKVKYSIIITLRYKLLNYNRKKIMHYLYEFVIIKKYIIIKRITINKTIRLAYQHIIFLKSLIKWNY